MRQLQWSVAWVRDFVRRSSAAADRAVADRTTLALDLIAAALEEDNARSACRVAATELAFRLGCERVSFGFSSAAISRSPAFRTARNSASA